MTYADRPRTHVQMYKFYTKYIDMLIIKNMAVVRYIETIFYK
jgi:hypothetical protein